MEKAQLMRMGRSLPGGAVGGDIPGRENSLS